MKNLMKLLCVVLMLTLFVSAASADQLSDVLNRGELVIATEGAWAPWTYHDEADKLVGFDVEIAEKIAERLGVKAVFVECEWDSIFAGIDSKRYDLTLNGVEATVDRAEKYDFSEPYAMIRTALIVRSDREDINSFEDLKGKTTTNSLGSTYEALAQSYGATNNPVDDLNTTLQLVLQRRVDATLNAEVSFADFMREQPDAPLKVVALTEEASPVVVPFRNDGESDALREKINAIIADLRNEGILTEISIRYFGRDITSVEQ